MSDKNGVLNDRNLFIVLAVLFVILGVGYFLSLGPLKQPEIDIDVTEVEKAYNAESNETEDDAAEIAVDDSNYVESEAETAAISNTTEAPFDMALAKRERILGDSSAPIKVTEHSSFSCGHCGNFHRETFDIFKENYIDTGKAYLVFSDFPLNAPALHASMAARCVAEDQYFDFVKMLFERQDDWATQPNYLNILEGYAADYGLDKPAFVACVQNEELRETLMSRIRATQQQYNISSTPSFVVNNQEVIAGAFPWPGFGEAIEAALVRIEESQSNAAPGDVTAPGNETDGAQ